MNSKYLKSLFCFIAISNLLHTGCVSTAPSEVFVSKKTQKKYVIAAKVNGRNLSADIILNGQVVMNQTWPPFNNSRNQKTVNVDGDEVKSVLKILKGTSIVGRGTGVIINVSINDEPAAEFVF